MKNKTLSFLLIGLFLSACAGGPVGNKNVPQPAKAVEIEKYLGKWYEIARYENRFEKDCEAVTAEYNKLPDGKVGIKNSCRKNGIDGPLEVADGKAKIVEGSNNTKFKVSFWGPLYVGNYWILDRADDYSWAIVGEPSGRYLWILSRKAPLSEKERKALYTKAKKLNYDLSLVRETAHR